MKQKNMNRIVKVFEEKKDNYRRILTKIKGTDIHLNDLFQDVLLILFQKDDKLIEGMDDRLISGFIYKTMLYQTIDKYQNYNKYYSHQDYSLNKIIDKKEYIEHIQDKLVDNNTQEINKALENLESLFVKFEKDVNNYLNRVAKRGLIDWYQVELFKKYYFENKSYRKIGATNKIHYTSIFHKVKDVYLMLLIKFKDSIQNIREEIIFINRLKNDNNIF